MIPPPPGRINSIAHLALSLATMSTKQAVRLLGILLLLTSSPCFHQSSPVRPDTIESHSRKAQEFLRENRPDLAIPEFRAIVALDRSNVDAHGNLGVLLFFQGDYGDAIPHFR